MSMNQQAIHKSILPAVVAAFAFSAATAFAQPSITVKEDAAQLKADQASMHRQIKRLEVAEARLKADTREGKMTAESPDAEKVYRDHQAVKGEKKAIAGDMAKLKADQKK